ncbi:MAG: hypothetical protein K6D98_02855 [Clostridiales bacterium]|nr:hypothetical protein [Clostridiales bacterium]
MKIAYVGIDLLSGALKYLLRTDNQIMKIFTCKTDNFTEFNTGIIDFAKENGIPCTLNRITLEDVENLVLGGCKLIVCAGYYHKLPVSRRVMTVNIHPSLLPEGRGPWPMPYDILNDNKIGGVTLHKVSTEFDEGDIILQRSFAIEDDENLETLMQKVNNELPDMLKEFLNSPEELYNNAMPQGEGTYLKMPGKEEYTVTEDTNFEQADRILRAFYGYECYFRKNGQKEVCLIKARAKKDLSDVKEDEFYFDLPDGYVICKKKNVYYDK